MKIKEVLNLLARGAAAIEDPSALTTDELRELTEDLTSVKDGDFYREVTFYTQTQDNGDGSVSTTLFDSEKNAEAKEEQDLEDGMNGWGESSVSKTTIKVDGDGNPQQRDKRSWEDAVPVGEIG